MQQEIFEGICEEIRGIDESSDPIATTIQLRDFDHLLRETIQSKSDLRNLFSHFNKMALDDSEFAVKLVYVLTTGLLQNFEIDNLKIREVLLNILQFNFEASSKYKEEKIEKFYNSITLLGECYNKVRLANNIPIAILGKSLINILQAELDLVLKEKDAIVTEKLANLVLTQVVLNGSLAKAKHRDDLEQLMFSIRKCLIEISNLSSHTKSFLLMAIDLYYDNFLNLGGELESYYGKFLLDYDKKTETPKKLPALEMSLRDKLKIKPAEVKFERPALAIDKKVEELVTQKDNLVPELVSSQEPSKPKIESPKKSSPVKNSKESHSTEDANESGKAPEDLKVSTDTSKNATKLKTPTIEKQQVKKSLSKSPQSSSSSSSSSKTLTNTKNSKISSKAPEKPLRASKEKEVSKNLDKNPVKSPRTPSNAVKSQQIEKSPRTPEKSSSNQKKSQNRESLEKSEKSLEKCSENGTESNETSEPSQSNENQVINQIDFLDKNIKPNSVPETSDVTNNDADPDSKKNNESSASSSISNSNGADEANILKQQNSCREIIGSSTREKFNGKVYFREENTENLTWENPNEDEMPETPPKLTPYSTSFLAFLAK